MIGEFNEIYYKDGRTNMNVRNCKKCGKMFNYVSGPITCPACRESMEAKFQEVKEYIREHKGVNINQVAEACDVEPAQVSQWLREDRLEVTEDSALMLQCESCGTNIRSGRFCANCKNNLLGGLKSVGRQPSAPKQPDLVKKKESPKMRFIN